MKPARLALVLASAPTLALICAGLLAADSAIAQATKPPTSNPAWVPAPSPPATPGHDVSVQISAYIRCIFQDRDGHLWFGTNTDGVCRYDGKSLVFINMAKDGLAGHAVREIVQTSDGALWFTTEGGVSRYHDGAITNYTTADGLPSNDTWSMMLDHAGTLWVGTREGVCRYVNAGDAGAWDAKAERAEKRFVAFPIPRAEVEKPEFKFDPRLAWSMYEDRAPGGGNIWFAMDGEGARKFDGKSFMIYTAKDGLCGNQVRCILGDRQGRIWIGAEEAGVSCYDGKTFRNYTVADGLGNNRVYRIYEDKAGNLWYSTLADGVTRYDGTTFTVYRQLGNLTRTHVQSMLEDTDGTLWVGCSGGLFRFVDGNPATFINVTKDGPWR